MYTLKGFLTYSPFVNNSRDHVAVFGELSSNANTYAKDKFYYTDESAPRTMLVAFHSVEDDEDVSVPGPLAARVLDLSYFLYQRAAAGQNTDNPAQIMQSILAEFPGIVTDLTMGEILQDGIRRLPEWITYTDGVAADNGDDNRITVWFADESFQLQYPEYAIEVVPPFIPLDDFFLDPLVVQEKLNDYNYIEKIAEVQTTRGEYPYTYLVGNRYNYRDPLNPDFQVPSYWIVLIYGQAGNNPDVIKNALIDYILENSSHTREEWTDILPELFITTEFIYSPFWNNYSVPNLTLQAGIYSPTINPREVVDQLTATVKGPMYSTSWIENEYELSSNIYKSLSFGVVGNPDNRDGMTSFYEQFPDYMLVTNDSTDFNRISPETQEWMVKFSNLIKMAETLTPTSNVLPGYSRVTRDGVLYAATMHDNITHLVVAKHSVEQLVGP